MASKKSFELKFHKANVFKDIISAMAEVLDEAVFKVDSEGFKGYGLSPDRAVFIALFYPSDGFEVYNVEKEVSFGVNVDEFKKILARGKSKDELGLILEKERLKVQFIRGGIREFEIGILSDVDPTQYVDFYENKLKQREFNSYIKTDGKLLLDALRDAKLVGESITLKTTENEFIMECSGVTASYKTVIRYDDPACFEFEVKEPSTSNYSLELVLDILKGAKQEVSLEFSTNQPLKIKYTVDIGIMEAFIAPRIEE